MTYLSPNDIHIITREDLNILFLKSSATFYKISEETKSNILEQIKGQPQLVIDESPLTETEPYLNGKFLKILLLNVSNECNLSCKYCYNQHGTYGDSPAVMDKKTALQAIDLIFQHYDQVGSIQFFGGEPLLNLPVIEAVCEYVTEKLKDSSDKIPYFGLNTNGIILNASVINLINKYNIKVSVSLDGDEEIHDLQRINASGKGTYQTTKSNIIKMYNETGMPNCIEVVYSQDHISKGKKVTDVIDSILSELNHQPKISLNPIAANPANYPLQDVAWDYFTELIQREFEKLRLGEKPVFTLMIDQLLRRLFYRESTKLLCHAGFYKLAVNATGEIYPCNGLAGQTNLKIAHITDSPEEFSDKLDKMQEYLASWRKTTFFKECQNCWMYNLCTYCFIYQLWDGELDLTKLNSKICLHYQKIVEELVVQLVICKENETHWSLLEKYIQG